ncbi:DUF6338 family protein [Ilumatobacter sp.]|uniref:DUF6338 family protein n=1 Tax=Ilumatobacter sp. TaxID=1967498 RepID=UPI0037539D5D
MIPDTLGALLAFFAFVAPGISFELRRERRRQSLSDSAFREASRTALASVVFSLFAIVVLALTRALQPSWVVDVPSWIGNGVSYVADHPRLVLGNFVAFVVLSIASALVVEWVTGRRSTPTIRTGTIWYEMFNRDRPDGTKSWVCVHLKSGEQLYGYVDRYSTADPDKSPDLYLVGAGLTWKSSLPRAGSGTVPVAKTRSLDDKWSGVHVSASEISWIRLSYEPRDDGQSTTQSE